MASGSYYWVLVSSSHGAAAQTFAGSYVARVTAVAPVKSPRSNRKHVFGIFTPSKNYRFEALSERDAEDWINRIRGETPADEDEAAFLALSLAADRFGARPLIVTGTEAFRREVADVSAIKGLSVTFADPVLERKRTRGRTAHIQKAQRGPEAEHGMHRQ